MKEIWKDVKGYEGVYKVSNIGNVKSLYFNKEKVLVPILNKNGYLYVNLWKNRTHKHITIHNIVSIEFLNHKPDGTQKLVVNHIDNNKLNNSENNLEIVTQRQNSNQKHIKSTSKYVGVSWYKRDKKWRAQITLNGTTKSLGRFRNEYDAYLAYQRELAKINKI